MSGEANVNQKKVPLILNCDKSVSLKIQKLMTENALHMIFH